MYRWAEVSGFDGIVPDPERFKEVIMLCCAIKPLCAWNCQVSQPCTLAQTDLLLFSDPLGFWASLTADAVS